MFWIFLLILLLPSEVFAYLDPGTGAALVNLIIAGIATLIFSMKGFFISLVKKTNKTSKTNHSNKTLAILSEGKMYFTTFEPIIRSLLEARIEFYYYTLDVEDPALTIDNELMHSRFLGYGALAYFRAGNIKVDYLLCTTPNIGCPGYPIRRSPRVQNLIHVFHSINDLSMYRKGSLDHYDTVFLVGDFQIASIRELERKRHLKEKKIVSLGIPYLDIYAKYALSSTADNTVKTILIGSSWGTKGLLSHYGTGFIRGLAELGYQIIVRPHPQSVAKEQSMLAKCKQDLAQCDNLTWDFDPNPQQAMIKADLLISDTSSLRFDYAFVYHKPVITLEIPMEAMPGFERDELSSIWSDSAEREIGFCLAEQEISLLPEHIERTLSEFKPDRIRSFRDATIANYAGCGPAIADYFKVEPNSKRSIDA